VYNVRMRKTALLLAVGIVSTRLAAATAPAAAAACDAAGLTPLLVPGAVLLVGEVHGGVETPALVSATACAATTAGLATTVALEIPRGEGARIERFLASAGSAADRDALLAGEFWTRDLQDGRSSVAMLALLEALRSLRAAGKPVRVALLDADADVPLASGQARADFMGQRLVEAVEGAGEDGLVLALAGNVHTRTRAGVPWDASYRPAGMAVEARWPRRTIALLAQGPAGETWMCQDSDPAHCGVQPLGGRPVDSPGSVELYPAPHDGYDGSVRLAAATAAVPARRGP
jgi:hypothetical protein